MAPLTMPTPPGEPRVVHYLLAHRGLPRQFVLNPPLIMGIWADGEALRFVGGMAEVIERQLPDAEPLDRVSLHAETYELPNETYVALLRMPQPLRIREAFFVAMAARLEPPTLARAFTLDLAGPATDDPLVGILEWDAEGEYEILDPSCAPDPSAFVDTIEALLGG